MEDIDAMFTDLLGEMDDLSQSLMAAAAAPDVDPASERENTFSIGFMDLKESLHELEDQDLDALVADLGSDLANNTSTSTHNTAETSSAKSSAAAPPPSDTAESSGVLQASSTKEEKVKVALERLKEAKVRKLVVKVLMSDGSSKALMVDETQTVREVLDQLFEKTHCDRSIHWSLCETNPELQIERSFEDHECLGEQLSVWTQHSENKIYFVSRPQKYVMFTDPQIFYMWKKRRASLRSVNDRAKDLLLKENFGGSTLIVPDLEGTLFLKEDGKKVWKPRYFMLRASGIYYVPKGKTKSSKDLACFTHFENINVYTTDNYKQKYRAPTNFCFLLKHPCIQRESHHIKILCCEDERTLLLWINSIRISKYGTKLYHNYQAAVKRASTFQTARDVEHKDKAVNHAEDYPDESPPDFIPPPPPGHTQL